MELLARDHRIRFPRRPLIMGIVNINDDSFCGDGRVDCQWALEKARGLVAQGADIIDVGAESARTNRPVITPEEEFGRLKPFLERFPTVSSDLGPRDADQVFPPLLSLNTWRPEVAAEALAIGGSPSQRSWRPARRPKRPDLRKGCSGPPYHAYRRPAQAPPHAC